MDLQHSKNFETTGHIFRFPVPEVLCETQSAVDVLFLQQQKLARMQINFPHQSFDTTMRLARM